MGAWWWEVWWGLWLALGWAVLGTAVSLAAWHLGRRVRQKTRGCNSLSLSLSRLGVAFHSACVLLTPTGPARLRSLRALVAWLQHPTFWASCYIHHYAGLPDALPDALAVCVLEEGPEAAPLLDAVWDVYQSTRLTAEGRERLFTEAFLGRLRAFFLASEDPACQRAALRLHGLLSCELLEAKWAAELPEALLPQLLSRRAPPVERHQLHLLRSQVARNQAFLRHPDFVASLRGRLRGGDPGGLLLHARSIYRQDASEVALGPLHGPGCYTSSGSAFLFLPVLRDLLLNYDRLSKEATLALGSYRPFRLCPTLRPEEAVAVMEDCVVPLLRRAEELPPAGLRCLLHAFPTRMDYKAHSALAHSGLTPRPDPDVAAAGVALGRRLRGLHFAAVQSALASGRLTDAQHWALVGGLCGDPRFPHGFPHRYVDCPELCRLLLRDTLRLPLTRESRQDALGALYGMIRVGELWASLAWGGGFVVIRRLIDLHQPPYKTINCRLGLDFGLQLSAWVLQRAGNLFRSHVPGQFFGAPLEPAEATRRLLAWREAGAGPALRRLIDRQPPPGSYDHRHKARGLLQLHDDLLRHHPIHTHSRLPHDIHFPDD